MQVVVEVDQFLMVLVQQDLEEQVVEEQEEDQLIILHLHRQL
jgi:hypothetical protein